MLHANLLQISVRTQISIFILLYFGLTENPPPVVSVCDDNDFYCDSGTSIQVHASYIEGYHKESIAYILSTLDC